MRASPDPAQARQWYEKGAAGGDGWATNFSAGSIMYDRGIGVPRDYEAARKWYEKAVPLGDSFAMNNLGSTKPVFLPCFQLRPAPRISWARLAGPSGFGPLDHTGGQSALPMSECGGAVL
jgi:Sel1 repeat